MGIHISVLIDLRVSKTNQQKALDSINAIYYKGKPRDESAQSATIHNGQRVDWAYAFTTNPSENGYSSLEEALSCWRYESEIDSNGDLRIVRFTGGKKGQDTVLYEVLAPFVDSGGIAVVEIESSETKHSYCFKNGKVNVKFCE